MRKYVNLIALAVIVALCSCSTQKADFVALTSAADSCYMAGDYVGASDYYGQALLCEEVQPYNYFNAACCAAKAEEYDLAFKRLNTILKKYPDWYSRDIEKDQDLQILHTDPRWAKFAQAVMERKVRIEAGYEHPLYDQLMAIMDEDQTIRNAYIQAYYVEDSAKDSLLQLMLQTDTIHMQFVDSVIAARGWVGKDEIGDGVYGIWFVVQHYGGDKWLEYLPLFKEAVVKGDLDQYHVDATEMYIQEYLKNDNE